MVLAADVAFSPGLQVRALKLEEVDQLLQGHPMPELVHTQYEPRRSSQDRLVYAAVTN